MTFRLFCTVCTFERDVETLQKAFEFEDAHHMEWSDTHIIEITRLNE